MNEHWHMGGTSQQGEHQDEQETKFEAGTIVHYLRTADCFQGLCLHEWKLERRLPRGLRPHLSTVVQRKFFRFVQRYAGTLDLKPQPHAAGRVQRNLYRYCSMAFKIRVMLP